MAQVKKVDVRNRILVAAQQEFREKNYQNATINSIAAAAGVTPSNIYNYYHSKFKLFYEVYAQYIIARLKALSGEVEVLATPRAKIDCILRALWSDIPNDKDGLSHNLMEAIITAPSSEEKPHSLLKWCEDYVGDLLRKALPVERRYLVRDSSLPFLLWMAFDGFSVNVNRGEDRDLKRLIAAVRNLLLAEDNKPSIAKNLRG